MFPLPVAFHTFDRRAGIADRRNIKPHAMQHPHLGIQLPPGVEGRPKGELHCRFGNVRIARAGRAKQSGQPSLLLIRWWGDAGPPLRLQLVTGSTDDVLYPVCCGPKHLIRYLRDMSSLVLVLEEAATHAPIGRCAVDIRFLDVGRPVSGTFPLMLPQDTSGGSGTAAAVGAMLRHVGTLDVHLEIGFHAASNISSFEINEHMAAQDARTPRSEQGGRVAQTYSHSAQGSGRRPQQQQQHSTPQIEQHAVSDVARFDQALEQLDLFELLLNRLQRWACCEGGIMHGASSISLDPLLEVMHGACSSSLYPLLPPLLASVFFLHRDFPRFCDVFDAWKKASGAEPLSVAGLMAQLQAQR